MNNNERFKKGDIVQHFKRDKYLANENIPDPNMYLYEIIDTEVYHTETKERLVIYKALYAFAPDGTYIGYKTFARPYDMFVSEVDREKYPDVTQTYRFEKVDVKLKDLFS